MNGMLIAGNWKMNGLGVDLEQIREIEAGLGDQTCDALICPPSTLLSRAAELCSRLKVGGQNCHPEPNGAHTGDVSAQMLADAGASHVIVGHSERRADAGETDEFVRAKASAAHDAGLVAIICVGETEAEREAGQTSDVLRVQTAGSVPSGATAANTVIAYEPVWAIGSGKVAAAADVAEAHKVIRDTLAEHVAGGEKLAILYGGSVKPGNAAELLAVEGVDGALVGGASLKATDFLAICHAAGN